ncbi:carbohydrate kinase family protein [Plantactinospora sp. KLBMP9567]|uniref:carbohydrate kinase family protein n=1 Tax=Plantactinospora sp. KLBMP9567 TaxID=3085900 RepID=UPI002981369F|nr:carbohydrate kinase family protein [Plantactinospora sp. KLBMP9567]MDW5330309.1 carbohydrate kinase family protein [Plantactinospora sp. KLBMP9567]
MRVARNASRRPVTQPSVGRCHFSGYAIGSGLCRSRGEGNTVPSGRAAEERSPAILAIGMVSIDHYVRVTSLPRTDEKVNGVRIGWFVGGMAANFAVAARQFCPRSQLISTFGDDPESTAAHSDLQTRGIDTSGCIKVPDANSLSSLTLIDGNADRVMAILDSNLPLPDAEFCTSEVASSAWDIVYAVALDAEWCRVIGSTAQKTGAMVAFDLEPFFIAATWGTSDFAAMMESAHLVFLKMESARLAGFAEAAHAAKALQEMGPQVVIVTDGPGSIYCLAEETRFSVTPPKVHVVDPTGAGDAFAGAFCGLYAQRRPVAECLVKATAIGGLAVSELGCQTYAPVRSDLFDSICQKVQVARLP